MKSSIAGRLWSNAMEGTALDPVGLAWVKVRISAFRRLEKSGRIKGRLIENTFTLGTRLARAWHAWNSIEAFGTTTEEGTTRELKGLLQEAAKASSRLTETVSDEPWETLRDLTLIIWPCLFSNRDRAVSFLERTLAWLTRDEPAPGFRVEEQDRDGFCGNLRFLLARHRQEETPRMIRILTDRMEAVRTAISYGSPLDAVINCRHQPFPLEHSGGIPLGLRLLAILAVQVTVPWPW